MTVPVPRSLASFKMKAKYLNSTFIFNIFSLLPSLKHQRNYQPTSEGRLVEGWVREITVSQSLWMFSSSTGCDSYLRLRRVHTQPMDVFIIFILRRACEVCFSSPDVRTNGEPWLIDGLSQ